MVNLTIDGKKICKREYHNHGSCRFKWNSDSTSVLFKRDQ